MSFLRVTTKPIGELLLEYNVINKEQLNAGLEEQKKKGGYLGQHLIALGFAQEVDIAKCLAMQYGFAYLHLENLTIAPQVLRLVPFKLINIYSLLPIEKKEKIISVVMADPLNEGVIDMLRVVTKCDIEAFISTYSEIRKAIHKYFKEEPKEKGPEEEPGDFDIIRTNIAESFIQTKSYTGVERRKFKRVSVDLDMLYFVQDKMFKGKIKNIGYNGILFSAYSPVPINKTIYSHIVCKISLQEAVINSVIQIVRVEKLDSPQEMTPEGLVQYRYNIAGFFNFMTGRDKRKLAKFLREKICQGAAD